MRSKSPSLVPGPRDPMRYSTSVLVCLAARTQDDVVRGQSGKARPTSLGVRRIRIASSRCDWWFAYERLATGVC